jgi:hypothetical protein
MQGLHHVFSVLDLRKDCAKSGWNGVVIATTASATKETFEPWKSQHEAMNGWRGNQINFEHHHGFASLGARKIPPQIVLRIGTKEISVFDMSGQIWDGIVGKQEDNVVDRFDQGIERTSQTCLCDNEYNEAKVVGPVIDEMFHQFGQHLQIV